MLEALIYDDPLIYTDKDFFLRYQFPNTGHGRSSTIMYDSVNEEYVVRDVPTRGKLLRFKELPEDGVYEIQTYELIEHAPGKWSSTLLCRIS